MSGNVGAQYTPAAGWAQAVTYRRDILGETTWQGAVAAALGGDGSTAANGFWAALNIATTQRLPLLFFVEDNGYAISVPAEYQNARANIADALAAFAHLRLLQGDGTDPAEAAETIAAAVDYVRSGQGPCLLRLSVVRLSGHSFTDNQAYKTPEIRAAEAARDPLARLRAFRRELDWESLEKDVATELSIAFQAARESPEPNPASAVRFVFFEGSPQRVGGLLPEDAGLPANSSEEPDKAGPRLNLIDAVRRALDCELERNPR